MTNGKRPIPFFCVPKTWNFFLIIHFKQILTFALEARVKCWNKLQYYINVTVRS